MFIFQFQLHANAVLVDTPLRCPLCQTENVDKFKLLIEEPLENELRRRQEDTKALASLRDEWERKKREDAGGVREGEIARDAQSD